MSRHSFRLPPNCTPGVPLRESRRRIKWRLCVGMGCFLMRRHFTSAIFTSLYLPHFNTITFARDCTHCVLLVVRQFEPQALPKSAMVLGVPCPVLAKETRDGSPRSNLGLQFETAALPFYSLCADSRFFTPGCRSGVEFLRGCLQAHQPRFREEWLCGHDVVLHRCGSPVSAPAFCAPRALQPSINRRPFPLRLRKVIEKPPRSRRFRRCPRGRGGRCRKSRWTRCRL